MQAHRRAADVDETSIDGADHPLHEGDEGGDRLVRIGDVPLQGKIGAVQLQGEAVRDDGFVFHLQGGGQGVEIGFLAIVIFVRHGGGDGAGRGRGDEGLALLRGPGGQDAAKIGAFGFHKDRVQIAHLAH